MTSAGVAQQERRPTTPEDAGLTPAPRSNPWAIGEEAAAIREAEAARHTLTVANRCLVPGMPRDHVIFLLARHGLTLRDLEAAYRLFMEQGHAEPA